MKTLWEIMYALHTAGLHEEHLALRHYIDERDALLDEQQKQAFTVLAGKYEGYWGYDRNCKYCEDFATLDEAISAYDQVREYPWVEIQYKGRVLHIN